MCSFFGQVFNTNPSDVNEDTVSASLAGFWFKLSSRIERVLGSLGRQFAGQWSLWERTDGAQNFELK
ncbi:hypothetical protein B9J09_01175 [Xylella fastidiosa subsp. pauca]|nr:hypothetical protein B9J09_01175 [Xylella fastidiosa subsp. pauca]AVI20056.1 hypothetical protein BCV75_01095 [Xylella fastidiosa]KIA59049.1 hypothetical protein RA12_01130 [Xylella fastidiosa]KXB12078.1 hypothetical protein ADT33_08910 [Xylella fastidiosa]KXB12210.1 hypothetical protein ADT32_03720 [Xylella fastidiosa]